MDCLPQSIIGCKQAQPWCPECHLGLYNSRKNRSIKHATTKSQCKNTTQTAIAASGYTTRLSVRQGGRTAGSFSNEVDRESISRTVTNRSQTGRSSLQGELPCHDGSDPESSNSTSTSANNKAPTAFFSSINTPMQHHGPVTNTLYRATAHSDGNNQLFDDPSDSESNASEDSVNPSSPHLPLPNLNINISSPTRNSNHSSTQSSSRLLSVNAWQNFARPSSPPTSDPFEFLAQRQQLTLPPQNDSRGNIAPQPRTNKKNLRGSLQISSLNIRGGGSNTTRDKWSHLWQVMRQNQIGVLAIQESHISTAELRRLEDTFSGRLQILSSIDNDNPNSKGVAFLLNKQLTAWKEAQGIEIIPGRALLLCLPWHDDKTLNILNIYAPNTSTENQTLWSDLHRKWRADALTAYQRTMIHKALERPSPISNPSLVS
ncbi:hypothetical protein M422DRAFT_261293 [Sphaerobolus stellatus SS14]|uniref:Endonuclease/exonuclease/phosphatase domain-containing protein n=1 Tax=Sphaerobolus stellatus (strain SS14) TaxID=990650 RepID=A0A0C9U0R7_SPHS4|nr:hypothetical protein M422DRAFT_261293 [Sphaerobolus stellatus SS14]